MLLTYREETKQPDRRPSRSLSSLQRWKADPILHGSYFLPYRNTVSTPDASGMARRGQIL